MFKSIKTGFGLTIGVMLGLISCGALFKYLKEDNTVIHNKEDQ